MSSAFNSHLGFQLQYYYPDRIVFKLCFIIFKCRHQTAPEYLQELCVPVTAGRSHCHLRSATRGDLQVLACRTSTFGPCSFVTLESNTHTDIIL